MTLLLLIALLACVGNIEVLAASTLSVSHTVENNLVSIHVTDNANTADAVSVLVMKKDSNSIVYMDQAVLQNGEYTFKTILPKGEYSGYVSSATSDKVAIEGIVVETDEMVVGYKAIAPITVKKGETLVLPGSIIAIFNSGANREVGVQWTNIPGTGAPGKFTATGQINGSTKTVEVIVNVEGDIEPVTPTHKPSKPSSSTTQTQKSTPTPAPTSAPAIGHVDGSTIKADTVLDSATFTAKAEVTDAVINAALANAVSDRNGVKSVEILIQETEGARTYEITLPVAALSKPSSGKQIIKVNTPVATIELPDNFIQASRATGSDTITLAVKMADIAKINDPEVMEAIGDRPVVELSLKANGKAVGWENEQAPVKISIPYTPAAEEFQDHEHIVVWYIDGQGNAVKVPNGKYDPAAGMVTFTTTHFSQYAVSYVVKTFADISQYPWAKKQIEVLASKGIVNGTSDNTFSPGENITRADFLVLLVRTLELNADFSDNFSDVSETDYYYKAVGIAKALGITNGVGNNMFNPKEPISRQDMMVLSHRALKIAGIIKTQGSEAYIQKFKDKDKIAAYAAESVAAMVREGIIVGNRDVINPAGNATRAETAVIMYRIYNKR